MLAFEQINIDGFIINVSQLPIGIYSKRVDFDTSFIIRRIAIQR